jgi:hypothetical protein
MAGNWRMRWGGGGAQGVGLWVRKQMGWANRYPGERANAGGWPAFPEQQYGGGELRPTKGSRAGTAVDRRRPGGRATEGGWSATTGGAEAVSPPRHAGAKLPRHRTMTIRTTAAGRLEDASFSKGMLPSRSRSALAGAA